MGAIGDPYVNAMQIAARLGKADDGTYTAVALTASRLLERYTKRQFNKTEEATGRRFNAVDRCRLPVDDFHTLDDLEVTIGTTAVDVDTIDARPWDGIVDGQPGWPYMDLFRTGGTWPFTRRARITVTAQWGWDAVPEAVVSATLDAACELVTLAGNGTIGPVRAEAIDGYSVTYVNELFDQNMSLSTYKRGAYKRRTFGVA